MKHPRSMRAARLVALALPLLLVAGCPVWVSPLDTLDGTYWVEYDKGRLTVYELPAERVADAQWYALDAPAPAWFTGPALYETTRGGTWARVEDPETIDAIIQALIPASTVTVPEDVAELAASLAGLYWVEYAGGELAVYRLPRYSDEEGKWSTNERDAPAWYLGDGLYEVSEAFQWTRLQSAEDVSLDEILQLYDFGPRPPTGPAGG